MINNTKKYYALKNLRPGDIILTNNIKKKDLLISIGQKLFTKGSFTHTIICIGEYTLMEAVAGGVTFSTIQSIVFSDYKNFRILRYNQNNYPDFSNLFIEGSNKYSYFQYNTEGIISFTKITKTNKNKVFCSELVANIYNDYNIDLFGIPSSKVTPANFEKSEKFNDVTKECSFEINKLPKDTLLIYDKQIIIKENNLFKREKKILELNKKFIKNFRNTIPNFNCAYLLLINFYDLTNKGVLVKLFNFETKTEKINYLNNIIKFFNNNFEIRMIFESIRNIINKYDISSFVDFCDFIFNIDKYMYTICINYNFFDLHKEFENISESYLTFNSLTIDKYSIAEKEAYLEFYLIELKSKKLIQEKIMNEYNILIQQYKTNSNYKSIVAYTKNLKLVLNEIDSIIIKLNSNIHFLKNT